MWINKTGMIYGGDCIPGDREATDAEVTADQAAKDKAARIGVIQSSLTTLDIKRIRPAAEGDSAYLATLNTQAVALRAELKALL
jgi:hypothetical protein